MSVTQNTYTGNGVTTDYAFTFPYLKQADVKAEVNNALTTAFTFLNATTLRFNTAPGNAIPIRIFRDTESDDVNFTFFSGSTIRAQDLNDNFLQALYVSQETENLTAQAVGGTIPDGSIGTTKLADEAVTSTKIQPGAVDSTALADNITVVGITATGASSFNTANFSGNVDNTATGYFDLPVGTTAQRPGSANAGMVRYNTTISQFEGHNGTSWSSIGGGATGGGSDRVFLENDNTVAFDYTLSSNRNAVSAGPVTIQTGVTVTIPSGASWSIV